MIDEAQYQQQPCATHRNQAGPKSSGTTKKTLFRIDFRELAIRYLYEVYSTEVYSTVVRSTRSQHILKYNTFIILAQLNRETLTATKQKTHDDKAKNKYHRTIGRVIRY